MSISVIAAPTLTGSPFRGPVQFMSPACASRSTAYPRRVIEHQISLSLSYLNWSRSNPSFFASLGAKFSTTISDTIARSLTIWRPLGFLRPCAPGSWSHTDRRGSGSDRGLGDQSRDPSTPDRIESCTLRILEKIWKKLFSVYEALNIGDRNRFVRLCVYIVPLLLREVDMIKPSPIHGNSRVVACWMPGDDFTSSTIYSK